jgi:RNA polymerase sigma-70 factor (ECF subfamily)
MPKDDEPPEQLIVDAQELGDLKQALAELREDEQMILIMRFVERKSHQEVAETTGKSVSAVKSIQHRALVKLASLMGADGKGRHYLRGQND